MFFSAGCVSSRTHNLQESFFNFVFGTQFKTTVVVPGVPSADFHYMQMRLVKSMWFILAMTDVMRVVDHVLV